MEKQTISLMSPQQQEWTFHEQFRQLYEIDSEVKREAFLDDLFSFMQKRGLDMNFKCLVY